MLSFGVFFSSPEPYDAPLSKDEYWRAYSELAQEAENAGHQLFFVRSQDTYLGNGWFSQSWLIREGKMVPQGKVHLDALYNKGRFQDDGTIPIFNNAELAQVCSDKWTMYQLFSEYCPKTMLVTEQQDLPMALAECSTDLMVFKPQTGAEGAGVVIDSPETLLQMQSTLTFPAIVQEFLDTSGGVPGIMTGTHDLRLALFDGEILYSYLRTPPEGGLLANVAQGGRFLMIDPDNFPDDALRVAKKIDQKFAQFVHRFYSIDFGYTPLGLKIIEMNSELGLLPNSDAPVFLELKRRIIAALRDLVFLQKNVL